MKVTWRDIAIEIVATSQLLWLPTALLVLHYQGRWWEPNPYYLAAELVLLYGLPVFAAWRLARVLRRWTIS